MGGRLPEAGRQAHAPAWRRTFTMLLVVSGRKHIHQAALNLPISIQVCNRATTAKPHSRHQYRTLCKHGTPYAALVLGCAVVQSS
jgi:hypothetical protein